MSDSGSEPELRECENCDHPGAKLHVGDDKSMGAWLCEDAKACWIRFCETDLEPKLSSTRSTRNEPGEADRGANPHDREVQTLGSGGSTSEDLFDGTENLTRDSRFMKRESVPQSRHHDSGGKMSGSADAGERKDDRYNPCCPDCQCQEGNACPDCHPVREESPHYPDAGSESSRSGRGVSKTGHHDSGGTMSGSADMESPLQSTARRSAYETVVVVQEEWDALLAERDGYRNGNYDLQHENQVLRRELDDMRVHVRDARGEFDRMLDDRDKWRAASDEWERRHADAVAGRRGFSAGNVKLEAERDRLRNVLQRIADMPTEPRPDGTYNYSRNALVDMARNAIKGREW